MMYGREKSDSAIVAGKPTNKVVSATAEPVEPRAGAEGNANQQSTLRTQCRKCVSQALERIRQVRRHSPKVTVSTAIQSEDNFSAVPRKRTLQ
jgi:RNA-directed DNA polymerase